MPEKAVIPIKMSLQLSPLAYRTHRTLAAVPGEGVWCEQKLLLAVSGGLDSMALLAVFSELQSAEKFTLEVAHIIHKNSWEEVEPWQIKAYEQVRSHCQGRYTFHCNLGSEYNENHEVLPAQPDEAAWRKFRKGLLQKWRARSDCQWIVYAHHSEDLLETRLTRLVRGLGPDGLQSMSVCYGGELRPFLHEPRAELATYLSKKSLSWVDDPSNQNQHFLRNWLRHAWLPALEQHRPGASQALARSLENLATEQQRVQLDTPEFSIDQGVPRDLLLRKTSEEQRRLLAEYLFALGVRGFRRAHLDEALKRLKSDQRELEFSLAGCEWKINAQQICALPKGPK